MSMAPIRDLLLRLPILFNANRQFAVMLCNIFIYGVLTLIVGAFDEGQFSINTIIKVLTFKGSNIGFANIGYGFIVAVLSLFIFDAVTGGKYKIHLRDYDNNWWLHFLIAGTGSILFSIIYNTVELQEVSFSVVLKTLFHKTGPTGIVVGAYLLFAGAIVYKPYFYLKYTLQNKRTHKRDEKYENKEKSYTFIIKRK